MQRSAQVVLVAVLVVSALAPALLPATAVPLAPGDRLWTRRFDGPSHRGDQATALAVSPGGSKVFVTGSSTGTNATGRDFATIAYEASGAKVWVKRYDGPSHGADAAAAVAVNPSGSRVFVTGSSFGGPTHDLDALTVAYRASSGAQLWSHRTNIKACCGCCPDDPSAIAVSPDGSKVAIVARSINGYLTVAYSASNGSVLWSRTTAKNNFADHLGALAFAPSGSSVFVTGEQANAYLTIAYNASTGAKLWQKSHSGPSGFEDRASAIDVSPDGSAVFVTGTSFNTGTLEYDYATVAYDTSNGNQAWAKRYVSGDFASALRVSPDGKTVFVAGSAIFGQVTGLDYDVVAYAASDGTKLWDKTYSGPSNGDDHASVLGLSPDRSQGFITGRSYNSGYDYATVAFQTSDGMPLWSPRYDGPGNGFDGAADLAVKPDGSELFVTGRSAGAGTGSDYATIAYSVS